MIRAVFSAIVGYVVMAACVIGGIAILWRLLGSQFAFQGDSTTASTGWSLLMLLFGLVAAVLGGLTAARLAGVEGQRAIAILAAFVLALGVVSLVMQMRATPTPLPAGKAIRDLTFAEAGRYAVTPTWYNAAIVVVGILGVFIAGRLVRTRPEAM